MFFAFLFLMMTSIPGRADFGALEQFKLEEKAPLPPLLDEQEEQEIVESQLPEFPMQEEFLDVAVDVKERNWMRHKHKIMPLMVAKVDEQNLKDKDIDKQKDADNHHKRREALAEIDRSSMLFDVLERSVLMSNDFVIYPADE